MSKKIFVALALLCIISVSALFQNCSKVDFAAETGTSALASSTNTNNPSGDPEIVIPTPTSFTQSSCVDNYPFVSSTPATNVVFNESDVLVAYTPVDNTSATEGLSVSVWYSDEHALTLGVRQVVVKTAAGSTSTDYPISKMSASPSRQLDPQVGSTIVDSDQAGTDASNCSGVPYACSRPMWPAIFITDTTLDSSSQSGDWQYGGKGLPPHLIAGSWKAAVRTIDQTRNPATVTVATDVDPVKNNWDLLGIPAPLGAPNEGFSAVVSWDVSRLGLISKHNYRLQFMVHDGDQNKSGGDVGQKCVNIQVP